MEHLSGQIIEFRRALAMRAALAEAAYRLERLERASGGDREHAERVAADVDRRRAWREVEKPDLDGYGGFQR